MKKPITILWLLAVLLTGCINHRCDCLEYPSNRSAFQNSVRYFQGFADLGRNSGDLNSDGIDLGEDDVSCEIGDLFTKAEIHSVTVFPDSSIIFYPATEVSFWGYDREFILHSKDSTQIKMLLSTFRENDRVCEMEDGWVCVIRRESMAD